ncbi:MAG: hypothetical protein COA52_00620 [Hyphomicrobiales bacterium]|nr:MAG: hypothetical protein COA52_00620 [Hyphomicrobiales bacterium]
MFISIVSFFLGNRKMIMYGAIALFIAVTFLKFISLIEENAKKDFVLETQKISLEEKDKAITILKDTIQLNDDILTKRDGEIKLLEEELFDVTNNLGTDSTDEAAESLKEIFRRLK